MNAINMMAAELLKFKPLIFFTDDKQGYPVNNQLRWAKKLAAQILLVIIDLKTMIKVNKVSPDHLNIDEKKYAHEMWMIEFRSEFKNDLMQRFSHLQSEHSTYERDLLDYFNTDRVDPMYVPHWTEPSILSKEGTLQRTHSNDILSFKTMRQNRCLT